MSEAWTLLAEGLAFPEGPVFTPDGTLWWVEIDGGCLGRLRDGRIERFHVGGRPNGAACDGSGRLWFTDQTGAIRRLNPQTGRAETVAEDVEGQRLGKPNDLTFDAAGTLVFTCSNDARTEPVGYVCRLGADGIVHRVADGLFFPNGLAFSPAGTLVVAETYRHRLQAGPWDGTTWIPAPFAVAGGPVGPDGMAFDEEGYLWVAIFGTGTVRIFEPTGRCIDAITAPGLRPTNLAFDPACRLGLVVTETETGTLWARPDLARRPFLFTGPTA